MFKHRTCICSVCLIEIMATTIHNLTSINCTLVLCCLFSFKLYFSFLFYICRPSSGFESLWGTRVFCVLHCAYMGS